MFRSALSLLAQGLPLLLGAFVFLPSSLRAEEKTPRQIIAEAITASPSSSQRELILSLKSTPTPEVAGLLDRWKSGGIFIYQDTAVLQTGAPDATGTVALEKLADQSPLLTPEGTPLRVPLSSLETADTTSSLRRAMKEITDLAALADPNLEKRLRAIQDASIGQKIERLPSLLALQETEQNPKALKALETSIAIIELRSPDKATRLAALGKIQELTPLASTDVVKSIVKEAEATGDKETLAEAKKALTAIESHVTFINSVGTSFRGLSLGSVLLVVAIGLAITFGLMGIINMAHGEFIAIGAYTTYVLQNVFAEGLRLSPFGFGVSLPGLQVASAANTYFILAIPASFLVAALVGIVLERSVIRFLYKRPLESLLATWGISLVIQQILKFIFGSNNVQVTSPAWLSGNWTVNDIVFGWNRVFVIGFAALIIIATWLVLNKTSLGLLIRAVMQNRNMAACMGVRTERVNTMTFAFGCGLAGLAGAFLSQIGNVGPSMGQLYIVDSFMTVVVGGVGNILGTVISALGIGMADQSLQQLLGNPVFGKILVLGFIILFLQWRPAGLFVTRSRSLD
ncbi:MAG: urea ABC transporter permease subunit UrtB [Luteolibacter sp.]